MEKYFANPGVTPLKVNMFFRSLKSAGCTAVLLGLAGNPSSAAQQSPTNLAAENQLGPPAESHEVDLLWGVRIPMRDGVHLNATIFKPHSQKDPMSVIVVMTPYVADHDNSRAMYFAKNGYAFALVDVRGRGNSDGMFVTGPQEGLDGTTQWSG